MTNLTPSEIADISKTIAEAAKAQAEATSSLATADKSRADAEKVRQEVVLATVQQATALDSTKADLEAKRLSNQKTEQDNQADRINKMITWATAAVPDVASLQKNSLTVSSGTVLFEGRHVAKAMRVAAARIAADLSPKLTDKTVYVSADATILTSIAGYIQIGSGADVIERAVGEDHDGLIKAIDTVLLNRNVPTRVSIVAFEAAAVAAGVTGALAKQVAALFEVDVAGTVERTDVEALDLQATVINALLGRDSNLDIRLQFARIPSRDSTLQSTLKNLQTRDLTLARLKQSLDDYITELTDFAAQIADIETALQGNISTEERKELETKRDKLAKDFKPFADAKRLQSEAKAIIDKLHNFLARLAELNERSGLSPFQQALAVDGMLDATSVLLIVPPAKAESTQITVARRLFWPRLLNETTVTAKYIAVQRERVPATDQITARVQDRLRLDWNSDDDNNDAQIVSGRTAV